MDKEGYFWVYNKGRNLNRGKSIKQQFSSLLMLFLTTSFIVAGSGPTPPVHASLQPAMAWEQTYGGADPDGFRTLIQTDDGGLALAGYTESWGIEGEDFWLVKTDAHGNPQWNRTYGGLDDDNARVIIQTRDGGFALAGSSTSFTHGDPDQEDMWVVRTDAIGHKEWAMSYGGSNREYAFALIEMADGGFAVAGYTNSWGEGDWDFWLVRTHANGLTMWSKTYGSTPDETATAMIQTLDGGFAIVGSTTAGKGGSTDIWLVKTDINGEVEWTRMYGGTEMDRGWSVIQTTDGGFMVVGQSESTYGHGLSDLWLVKTDAQGMAQWNTLIGGSRYDIVRSIIEIEDGYVLAGTTHSYQEEDRANGWIVKTTPDGVVEWMQNYGGSLNDVVFSGILTSDGGIALAGWTNSYGNVDGWLMKTAPVIRTGPDPIITHAKTVLIGPILTLPLIKTQPLTPSITDPIVKTVTITGLPESTSFTKPAITSETKPAITSETKLVATSESTTKPPPETITKTVTKEQEGAIPGFTSLSAFIGLVTVVLLSRKRRK